MTASSKACVCGHVLKEASRFIGGKRLSGTKPTFWFWIFRNFNPVCTSPRTRTLKMSKIRNNQKQNSHKVKERKVIKG